jgi:large subunit ribosomal protein L2
MGKRIIQQARGRGGPRYRAPSHRYLGKIEYKPLGLSLIGKVKDILHDPGRSAPVAIVRFEDGTEMLHLACEGLKVGDEVYYGKVKDGSVAYLKDIPVGSKVFAIENYPGSGPKYCRASGSFAIILGKSEDKVTLQLPSGKILELDGRCRATVGVAAGGGRTEKPWVKAGKKWHAMRARGKLYPRTSANKMAPVDHPFGGKKKQRRPPVSRWKKPPGAKVGTISPKRVGRKKGRKL